MKRKALYSSSGRSRIKGRPDEIRSYDPAQQRHDAAVHPHESHPAAPTGRAPSRWRRFYDRYKAPLYAAAGGFFALLLVVAHATFAPSLSQLTQEDIDAAVLRTLETTPLPSAAAKAYAVIQPSVVRVRGFGRRAAEEEVAETSVGTGVIIVDSGVILTNLHVVLGAERVAVTFADGSESEARVIGARPEHDLAVLRATTLPDDVVAATLRSTQDLALGDRVIAVGFPFGLGPSVSAGVVSGLGRAYRSLEGGQLLTNLIQFDAAANPGSSGGPLVTTEGEVVGIVTSILNPTRETFFVGIGFAVPIENAAAAVGVPPF